MYEHHWRLNRKPFATGVDPEFYFPAPEHQSALLKLRYLAEHHRGLALVAGPGGCGKTLVVEVLARSLGEKLKVLHLVFPPTTVEDLLGYVALRLEQSPSGQEPQSLAGLLHQVETALHRVHSAGQHVLIVADEAHLLDDPRMLEALRLLTNYQAGGEPQVSVILVGREPLLNHIREMPSLEERLAVRCFLNPLDRTQSQQYVLSRLKAAGASEEIFTPEALSRLYELSGGVPRQINQLCDLAMLVAFADDQKVILPEHVESVYGEFVPPRISAPVGSAA